MTVIETGTVDQYIGTRPSLLVIEIGDTAQTVEIGAFLYGGGGAVTAGPLKLAQRVLFELLTVRGSVAFEPNRGCTFLAALYSGRMRTPALASQAFAQAAYEIRDTLQTEELETTPDDEKFGSLQLNSAQVFKTEATIDMTVRSAAGTGVKILFPLKTLTGA